MVYADFIRMMIQKIKENPNLHPRPLTLIATKKLKIQTAIKMLELVESDN
jgi:hypothetical protein